jgi:hypothetical protein
MEVPLKVEIKRREGPDPFTELSADIIYSPPAEMSIKVWTLQRGRLVEYEFWAVHVREKPIASSIGVMTMYGGNVVYEKEYLTRLRDEINLLLGDG